MDTLAHTDSLSLSLTHTFVHVRVYVCVCVRVCVCVCVYSLVPLEYPQSTLLVPPKPSSTPQYLLAPLSSP